MRHITILLLLFAFTSCHANYKYELSACAIFQDEAPYLKEWIEFHKLMGVQHFYLYNHRSSDRFQEVLKPYIQSGLVELKDKQKVANQVKIFNRLQCQCYTECLKEAKGVSKWVAFIDIDEFLFPIQKQTVPQVLATFEEFGGVSVNWHIFGTSNLKKISPDQLLIEQLTRCSKKSFTLNRYMKCIVRPERASHFLNPHHPVYQKGYYQVNTDKIASEGPFFSSYIQTNQLCINHYWTRDEDFFFHTKIPRQKRWGGKPIAQDILKKLNEENDEAILRFVPALKKVLQ